jgi:hypothetical protein
MQWYACIIVFWFHDPFSMAKLGVAIFGLRSRWLVRHGIAKDTSLMDASLIWQPMGGASGAYAPAFPFSHWSTTSG